MLGLPVTDRCERDRTAVSELGADELGRGTSELGRGTPPPISNVETLKD